MKWGDSDLIVGERYDFHTADGAVYEDSRLVEVGGDGTVEIRYGSLGMAVFLASHEFVRAEKPGG